MSVRSKVVVARGDGIGPEIMDAALKVLEASGAPLDLREIEIGRRVYERGHTSGIAPESWDALRGADAFLKAPITTPQGGGYKSLNVTIRKALGLYANVRPCVAYHPFVRTRHPGMKLTIIRENEEDLYAGIEHRQTDEVMQCLKLITRPGCERIARYAFEHARLTGATKVTCMTKDNIMKMTDGLFRSVFDEIGAEYPGIEKEHMIVDIGAARLADSPERFQVILLPNLYGDILSDVAAQISGSIGLAPSSNIGEGGAMFEAIHGSAPDLAGRGVANPSGLILSSVMMLAHLGRGREAGLIHNAWLKAIEDGCGTVDMSGEGATRRVLGTGAFAEAVVARLGERPRSLPEASYADAPASAPRRARRAPLARRRAKKDLVGVDVFLHWDGGRPGELGETLERLGGGKMKLNMITNRGVKVWPQGLEETFCTDHWRCRFTAGSPSAPVGHGDIVELLGRISGAGLDFIKAENLCVFDGVPGYSLGQGQ